MLEDVSDKPQAGSAVLEAVVRRGAFLTLNRPEHGNRLTVEMRRSLTTVLQKFDRDREIYALVLDAAPPLNPVAGQDAPFCLGDDAADWAEAVAGGESRVRTALSQAAGSIWQIDRFGKPYITFLSGPACGAGVGLMLHGTHSVACESATLAVSDIYGGRVIGSGLSWVLSRLAGHLGIYLALTGQAIDRRLALDAGLITHAIESRHLPAVRERLADADPVDQVLDDLHTEPGVSGLLPYLEIVERCFSAESPDAIIARLEAIRGSAADWSREVANGMRGAPPLLLAITQQLLTTHRPPDLRSALILEFRTALRAVGPEMNVKAGSSKDLSAIFGPAGDGELELPPEVRPPSIS